MDPPHNTVNPPPLPDKKYAEVLEEIIVTMTADESLGISITGGLDDPVHEGDPGIYIKAILDDGAAQRCKRLFEGDRLREINGQSLDEVTHDQAVGAIRKSLTSRHVSVCFSHTHLQLASCLP